MLDGVIQRLREGLAKIRNETDRRCPVCGAADAIKIDPLMAQEGPRPRIFRRRRPLLCATCSTLFLVDGENRAEPVSHEELLSFRRRYPLEFRAVAACQREYQRAQLGLIRAPVENQEEASGVRRQASGS